MGAIKSVFRVCSIPSCGKPHHSHGYCRSHAMQYRLQKPVAPDGIVKRGRPRIPPEERFWSMVVKSGPNNGCWLWIGGTTGRIRQYGHFCIGGRYGKSVLAHRFAYEMFRGPIPKVCEIDHLCNNTLCVNPTHLAAVPHRVNVLRGNTVVGNNAAKTHCKRGHPFTPENTRLEGNGRIRGCRACRHEAYLRSRNQRQGS